MRIEIQQHWESQKKGFSAHSLANTYTRRKFMVGNQATMNVRMGAKICVEWDKRDSKYNKITLVGVGLVFYVIATDEQWEGGIKCKIGQYWL